jgi:hypothetical protein
VLQHFHDICHAQAPSSHSHSSARELWPEWFQAPRLLVAWWLNYLNIEVAEFLVLRHF